MGMGQTFPMELHSVLRTLCWRRLRLSHTVSFIIEKLSTSSVIQAKKTLDKFESVCGLHISAVRQLILMFVAFYAHILDLFAAPSDAQFYTLLGGGGESIGGAAPPGVPVILTLRKLHTQYRLVAYQSQ